MEREEFKKKLVQASNALDPNEYDGDFSDVEEEKIAEYESLMKEGLKDMNREALYHEADSLYNNAKSLDPKSPEYKQMYDKAVAYMKISAEKGCAEAFNYFYDYGLGSLVDQLAYSALSLDYGFDDTLAELKNDGITEEQVQEARNLISSLRRKMEESGVEIEVTDIAF